jgi:RNA polymerase sigma-70 factor (ECF subfamily)
LVKKRMIEAQRGGTHKSNLAKLLVTFSISSRHGIDVQQNLGYAKDEFDILAAANSLDQDALAAIFDEYAPAIYKYLLRLGVYPQEADQIVGDVFARLLDKITEGKGPRTNLRSYLFQIAYHLAVDHARERQRTAPLDMAESANKESKPVQSRAEEKMLLEKLFIVMERELTEDQRNVIVLRFQEDFSLKETAEVLGKNVNAVKALQNRGIDKLRQAMDRLNEEI